VGRLNGDIMGSGSEEVVAHIRANYESATGPEFDFFVTSGDQVELGKLDHYKRYFSDWEWAMNAGIPWVAAPGNHETYYDDDLENYYRYFNYTGSRSMEGHPENFWVEYGNMLIVNIFLSTSGMYLYESDPRADVFTWVEAILSEKADDYDWVVLNQHHPVYMSSWYPSEDNPFGYDPILIEEELPLIETYGVDLVLMGHWHAYERLIKGNTTFMVTGGGGGGLDGWGTPQTLSDGSDNAESLVFEPTKHSYSVFDVNELQMNIITWATDGTLVDNTTIFAS
jgi:3',5'-cyclic AMP phosphodiesterase CpdA